MDTKSYYAGFLDGANAKQLHRISILGYDLVELINIIERHKMATRLITQAQLEALFPNSIQRNAFLDIMAGLVMVDPSEQLTPVQKAVCSIMIETEVRQGPDYGKITPGYPSAYGAGCLIEGLRKKDMSLQYAMVKANLLHCNKARPQKPSFYFWNNCSLINYSIDNV